MYVVDCEWGAWQIGKCSAECGGGKRIDTREEKQHPQYGGKLCSGEIERTQECNPQECPGNNYAVNIDIARTE